MPLILAKLISEDSDSELDAAIAAYKGGAGAELLDTQRAMAHDDFVEPDGDLRTSVLLCHGGIDTPASGAKTADLQHLTVAKVGDLAACQQAVDDALSTAVHETVTDANLDAVPNEISSVSAPFTTGGEDDGRKITVAGEERTIVSVTSTSVAVYDGVALTGTNQTVEILGAESLQDAHISMKKRSGSFRLHALLAVEGELY